MAKTDPIEIPFQATDAGFKELQQKLKGLGIDLKKTTGEGKKADSGFGKLVSTIGKGNIAIAAAAGVVVGLGAAYTKLSVAAVRAEDRLNGLRSSLKTFTGSAAAADSALDSLRARAYEAGQPLDTYTQLFGQATFALKEHNASQKDVIDFTDILNKQASLSGASVQDMANGFRQLSQGLASGTIRAEEFNSILENTPGVAKLLSDSMGKSIGEIRQDMLDGKLTAEEFFQAVLDSKEAVDKAFAESPQSLDQSMARVQAATSGFLAELSKAGGIGDNVKETVNTIADAFVAITRQLEDGSNPLLNTFANTLGTISAGVAQIVEGFATLFIGQKALDDLKSIKDKKEEIAEEERKIEVRLKQQVGVTKEIRDLSIKQHTDRIAELKEQIKVLEEKNAEEKKSESTTATTTSNIKDQVIYTHELIDEINNLNAAVDHHYEWHQRITAELRAQITEARRLSTTIGDAAANADFAAFGTIPNQNVGINVDPNGVPSTVAGGTAIFDASVEDSTSGSLQQGHIDAFAELKEANKTAKKESKKLAEDEAKRIEELEEQKRQAIGKTAKLTLDVARQAAESGLIGAHAFKAVAIGEATISTYLAANKALASAPPPFNYVLAGAVVAAGLANVGKITSTGIKKREFGGPVRAGEPYVVGERGPEVFTPNQGGNIIPSGGGLGGNVTVNNFGNQAVDARYVGDDLEITIGDPNEATIRQFGLAVNT